MGVQLGIKATQEAMRLAEMEGFDLVEIAPQANPPVCKIVDFDKFKYEQVRKWKDQHKKQHGGELKEVRFTPTVGDHDLETKLKHMEGFLKERDKVQVTIFFKGREIQHPELGLRLAERIRERVTALSKVDKEPRLEGKRLIMVLSPR